MWKIIFNIIERRILFCSRSKDIFKLSKSINNQKIYVSIVFIMCNNNVIFFLFPSVEFNKAKRDPYTLSSRSVFARFSIIRPPQTFLSQVRRLSIFSTFIFFFATFWFTRFILTKKRAYFLREISKIRHFLLCLFSEKDHDFIINIGFIFFCLDSIDIETYFSILNIVR